MKKTAITALIFFLALTWAGLLPAQSPEIRLSLVPLSNPAADPAAIDQFNQTMNNALAWLPRQPGLTFIPADTLAALLDDVVTPDFPDIFEPFSLSRANQSLRLDGVLFCRLERRSGRTVLLARALEYPSGILAGENEVPMLPDSIPPAAALLQPLLDRLAGRDTLLGTSFQSGEQGVLLLSGDLSEESHFDACQAFFSGLRVDERERPLRVKILPRDAVAKSTGDICTNARDLMAATNALWIYDLRPDPKGTIVRLWLPLFPQPQRPVTEWTFPVYPQIDELACVELAADTTAAQMINAALLQAPDHPAAAAAAADWQKNPALAFRAAFRSHLGFAGADAKKSAALGSDSQLLYRLAADGAQQKPLQAWSALHLGALLDQSGRTGEAIEALLQAETLFGPMANPAGLILSRRDLAAAYTTRQEWQLARQTLDRLMHIPPDSLTQAYTLQKIALLFEKDGRTNEAVQNYYRAAQMNLAINRPYEAAMVYQRLGQLMREKGDLVRSVAYIDTFLTQAQEMASEPALARAHFQMGLTRLARGERDLALDHFLNAGDYLEMLGDRHGMARADLNVGAIYWQMGDTLKARQRYFSVINQATAEGDSVMVLMSAVNLADIHLNQKNYSQAQAFFDRALTIAQEAKDAREQAKITYAKGLAYLKEGRLRAGYAQIKEAMALGGGSVNGDQEKEQAFLQKLSLLIGDIETLRGASPPRR